jgi:hypothetical protein
MILWRIKTIEEVEEQMVEWFTRINRPKIDLPITKGMRDEQ